MSSATTVRSDAADSVVRECIEIAIRIAGSKRGLHRAAEMLGVSDRWIKAFRFGEPAHVNANTYIRALAAIRQLRQERKV